MPTSRKRIDYFRLTITLWFPAQSPNGLMNGLNFSHHIPGNTLPKNKKSPDFHRGSHPFISMVGTTGFEP